ncbi:hypothetical protein MPNTM1_04605 [Mycolicibacterium parafortuitum]
MDFETIFASNLFYEVLELDSTFPVTHGKSPVGHDSGFPQRSTEEQIRRLRVVYQDAFCKRILSSEKVCPS